MASRSWKTKSLMENRKNEPPDDLLVFGYACKLFRDDEKASHIDRGRHLIPWMGDDSITIDRFDGRGHLYDLKGYDAEIVKRLDVGLTDEERKIETLCDEERYLELHTDIIDKMIREEEELKRLNAELSENPYQAIGFNYEQQYDPDQPTDEPNEEEEEPYSVPEGLELPVHMQTPDDMKLHLVIEKTAKFVAEQGGQFEIMIKTKQHNNPQFQFMNFESDLNPYYKCLINAIKLGKYKPVPHTKKVKRRSTTEEDDDDEEHSGYLHPSLFSGNKTIKQESIVATIASQLPASQIHGTAYAKLLSNMTRLIDTGRVSPVTTSSSRPTVHSAPPAIPPFMSHATKEQSFTANLPPPPGMEPVQLPRQKVMKSSHQHQPAPPGTELLQGNSETTSGSGSVSVISQYPAGIVPPPPDVQPIIDKMASYVVKNGSEFEKTVRAKKDPRFDFLNYWNVHSPYYQYKKSLFRNIQYEQSDVDKSSMKEISFSIKKKEEEPVLDKIKVSAAGAFEDSDEEGGRKDKPLLCVSDTFNEEDSRPNISTDDMEKKQAEEKFKNKLAAAAKERLASAGREKQLQAERKRRAAMFITMLKGGIDAATLKAEDAIMSSAAVKALSAVKISNDTPSGSRHSSPIVGPKMNSSPSRSPSKSGRSRSQSRSRRRRSRSPRSRSKRTRRSRSRSRKRSRRSRSHDRRKPRRPSRSRKDRNVRRKRSKSRSPRPKKTRRRSRSPKHRNRQRHSSSSSSLSVSSSTKSNSSAVPSAKVADFLSPSIFVISTSSSSLKDASAVNEATEPTNQQNRNFLSSLENTS